MPSSAPIRPRRYTTFAATTGLCLLLAACTGTGGSAAPTPSTASPSARPAPSTPTPTPTPTPSPTRTPFAVGAPWQWETSSSAAAKVSGSTVVTEYQQDVAHAAPSPEEAFGAESHGYVWAALKVKLCSDATSGRSLPVANSAWKLGYADGTTVEPSNTGYNQFPKPEFPFGDTSMAPGQCVAGAIVFPVPGDKRPTWAMYAPSGLDTPVAWTLPAQ